MNKILPLEEAVRNALEEQSTSKLIDAFNESVFTRISHNETFYEAVERLLKLREDKLTLDKLSALIAKTLQESELFASIEGVRENMTLVSKLLEMATGFETNTELSKGVSSIWNCIQQSNEDDLNYIKHECYEAIFQQCIDPKYREIWGKLAEDLTVGSNNWDVKASDAIWIEANYVGDDEKSIFANILNKYSKVDSTHKPEFIRWGTEILYQYKRLYADELTMSNIKNMLNESTIMAFKEIFTFDLDIEVEIAYRARLTFGKKASLYNPDERFLKEEDVQDWTTQMGLNSPVFSSVQP